VPSADSVASVDAVEMPSAVLLVGADGVPVGYVDEQAFGSVPTAMRGSTPLEAVALPLPTEAVVDGSLCGRPAVAAVAAASRHSPVMAVRGSGGAPIGLLYAADVARALGAAPRLGRRG
jgi:hypothetical protein